MLVGLRHRRDVVRVDADELRECGRETLAVRAGDGSKAGGKAGDGLRAVEQLQVDAARVVASSSGELDDRDRGVAADEIGRDDRLVDPIRDALEGGSEGLDLFEKWLERHGLPPGTM